MTYKDFALNIAKQAGEIIRTNFSLGMKKEWKGDGSPVTETDKEINRLVIDAVARNYPDHSVIGEEESSRNKTSEYIWVCDPLDGTIPFSHGVPVCTFALSLLENAKPILGVIYDPFSERLFFAETDKGTTLNGSRVCVNDEHYIGGKIVECANWRTARYYIPRLTEALMVENVTALHFASVQYSSMLVACGEFVGTICTGNASHDIAAVKIIVEEAGGKVTDLWGSDQRYDQPIRGAIVSNGKVHDQLLAIVQKNMQEK